MCASTTDVEPEQGPPGILTCLRVALSRLRTTPRAFALSAGIAVGLLALTPFVLPLWLRMKPTVLPSNVLPLTLVGYVLLPGLWTTVAGPPTDKETPWSDTLAVAQSIPVALVVVLGGLAVFVGILYGTFALISVVTAVPAMLVGLVVSVPLSLAFGFGLAAAFRNGSVPSGVRRVGPAFKRRPVTAGILGFGTVSILQSTVGAAADAWLATRLTSNGSMEVPGLFVRSEPAWQPAVACLLLSVTLVPLSWVALVHLYSETAP